MATIKDIARCAGVSQGTVSNVLNGKGNVSSAKILLVREAAKKLGYTANEKAKLLRKGQSRILSVILPNFSDRHYIDFLHSFTVYATNRGFEVTPFFSQNNPERECTLIGQCKSAMTAGMAVFTALGTNARCEYDGQGFLPYEILFVERTNEKNFIGFNYECAGTDMAAYTKKIGAKKITVVTGKSEFQNDAFYAAFLKEAGKGADINRIITDYYSQSLQIFDAFKNGAPDVFVCSDMGLAQLCKNIYKNFFPSLPCSIITVSPLFTLPESDFLKYELNYHYLGKKAAEQLIDGIEKKRIGRLILKNDGFRNWDFEFIPAAKKPEKFKLLLLESPAAYAVEYLAHRYASMSGIRMEIDIENYEYINAIIGSKKEAAAYDIIRIGADIFSWNAPRVLRNLESIDYDVSPLFNSLIRGVEKPFSTVAGKRYAVPISPSLQLLFYRKDLFEDTMLKRLYREQYGEDLGCPQSFEQYNRIASFFTASQNASSPTPYGTTVSFGSSSVLAGTEFMTRYFSYSRSLFRSGRPLLDSDAARSAVSDILSLKNCAPPPFTWWTEAASSFAEGRAAMTILFSNFATGFFRNFSPVTHKIGFAVIPGGNPLLGGGSLGICESCPHPEEALQFIMWLVREPAAACLALLGGNLVTEETAMNYEVIDMYPWTEMLRNGFARTRCKRSPDSGAPFDDYRFVSMLGKTVCRCWYDNCSAETALGDCADFYRIHADEFTYSI
ncbi:extracellular solute-binding protein [Treponema sp. HNW]|uniref:extracellular solute-binding protein n=1 Tax=Treponema sp. HNW TaxID=3116654 RepID=UPI003D0D71AE